jgi:hypothetical protein
MVAKTRIRLYESTDCEPLYKLVLSHFNILHFAGISETFVAKLSSYCLMIWSFIIGASIKAISCTTFTVDTQELCLKVAHSRPEG